MKFSYRHPDIAAKQAERSNLSEHDAVALVERRQFVRPVPTPAATEGTDEEMWRLWDKAELDNKAKK
jgi:hypothetical protein